MNGKIIKLVRADNDMSYSKSRFQYLLSIPYYLYGIYLLIKGNFSFLNSDTTIGLFAVILAIAATVYTIKKNELSKKLQLVLNDEYIKYRYSIKNYAIINLQEIDHIQLKVLDIIFILKNGEKKDFHLEDLSYKTVLQVKEEIKKFTDNKYIQLK